MSPSAFVRDVRAGLPIVPSRSASELATALRGRVVHGDPSARYEGISTDSRSVLPGELFVALRGERFDGATYLGDAARRGAAVALIGDTSPVVPFLPYEMAVIEVEDTLAALADLARRHRVENFSGRAVFGITGSAGKTSTRGFLHEIVRSRGAVASEKSFNNAVGVPLTILRLRGDEAFAVVEIGTNAPGEIATLCDIARPTIGIVTNVAAAHLEKLLTVEAVASEKGDLYRSLPASGVAIVNVAEPLLVAQGRSLRCRVVTIGVDREADFVAVSPRREGDGSFFLLDGKIPVRLSVPGLFHVENALAAIAAAVSAGVPRAEAAASVSRFAGEKSRLTVSRAGGVVIVDDCYNSNPRSCTASLRELAAAHEGDRRIAVLGEMLELGATSAKWHEAVGEEAGRSAEIVVAVGAGAGGILLGARRAGISASRLFFARDSIDAETCVLGLARPGDVVLVKGSRRIGLERVVAALGARFGGAARSS